MLLNNLNCGEQAEGSPRFLEAGQFSYGDGSKAKSAELKALNIW